MIFCELCQKSFSTHHAWDVHLRGETHREIVNEKQQKKELEERSVFITDFPPRMPDMTILQYFAEYGPIENFIRNKRQRLFVILEYRDKSFADNVLSQRIHRIHGFNVIVRPRKMKDRPKIQFKHNQETEDSLYESVIDLLLKAPDVPRQMASLVDVLQLTAEEIQERENICEYFNTLFSKFFLYSQVYIFGSSVNCLGTHGCDVDLLLALRPEDDTSVTWFASTTDRINLTNAEEVIREESRKLTINELSRLTAMDVIGLIKSIVKKYATCCSNVIAIPSKRCPIVRFLIMQNEKLSCDLSAKHRLCHYNSKLIRLYMKLDDRVLPLTYTIRYWVKQRRLSVENCNRISSYATTLLVIFYLQRIEPPILPSVQTLRELTNESRKQGGWECSFCEDTSKIPKNENNSSLVDLLKGFFDFYRRFEFDKDVVCPFSGLIISKEVVQTITPNFQAKKSICVQDPFDFAHNVTSNISDALAAKIFQAFQHANAICNDENTWVPTADRSPWGLVTLFDNIIPKDPLQEVLVEEEWGSAPLEPELESELVNGDDDHSSDETKEINVSFNILNACDVNQLRQFFPSTSNSAKVEIEWFGSVCKVVRSVFEEALQMTCVAEEKNACSNDANSSSSTNSRKRGLDSSSDTSSSSKKLRLSEEVNVPPQIRGQDWANDIAQMQNTKLDRFVCHVFFRTWVGRKKAKNVILNPNETVIKQEELISKHIIGESRPPPRPLYSFLCKVRRTSLSEVNVTLVSMTNSTELNGNVFSFLQSYVPKLVNQIHIANQIV